MTEADATLLPLARLALKPAAGGAESALEALDLSDPEQRRLGDYELLQCLGRGGMGVVFRAHQLSLQREVALKVMAGLADDDAAIARFHAEARAAARLHHPHIVPVYEVGRIGDEPFFSMPLLRGTTLAAQLDGRSMDEARAIDLLLVLCSAVGYAHSLGLLHLDLKPANVMLDEDGRPLIGDFGLAQSLDQDPAVPATESAGTPAYMAPEQIERQRGALSPCSDIYALGAMLYEFLVGEPPHGRGDAATLMQRTLHEHVIPPRRRRAGLSRDIDAICLKCLETEPARRYRDTDELTADLVRCRDGNAVSVRRQPWPERIWRSLRRHPALSLAVAAALCALLAGAALSTWQWQRAEAALRQAQDQTRRSQAAAARQQQLAHMLAAGFPSGINSDSERRRRAHDVVAAMHALPGGDAAAQGELLRLFATALEEAGKKDALDDLVAEIVDQLGARFRAEQVQKLSAAGTRESLLAAVLLGSDTRDPMPFAAAAAARAQLAQQYSDDIEALYTLALSCHMQTEPCTDERPYRRLVELDGGNAVSWIVVPQGLQETDAQIAARLAHAAAASRFDDHTWRHAQLLRTQLADLQPPESLRLPLRGVLDEAEIPRSIRRDAIAAVPLPRFVAFVRLCRPDLAAFKADTALRAPCARFATLAFEAPRGSVLARVVGSAMLRRLYPGRPEAQAAFALRRQYVWLAENFANRGTDIEFLQQNMAEHGEWQALLNAAARLGIAPEPPPQWQPQQPEALLLAEQRSGAANAPR